MSNKILKIKAVFVVLMMMTWGVLTAETTVNTKNSNKDAVKTEVVLQTTSTQEKLQFTLDRVEESVNIKVYNLLGEEIASKKLKRLGSSYTLDTQSLESGVYFLRIAQGNQSIQKRFVKL